MSEITKCLNEWNATIESLGQGKQTILIILPNEESNSLEIKYYATVEEVIDKSSSRIGAFNKFHIWTRDHVKDYLGRKEAKIWILRVYELDEPQILKRSNGMLYANVNKPVKLEGKPVISDNEFNKLKEEILNTK